MKFQRRAIAGQSIVITMIVAAVIISASILAASYLGTAITVTRTTTFTTTTTQLCQQQLGNATSAYISDCQLGITLTLGIKSATIATGNNETAYVSIHNELGSNNTVYLNGGGNLPPQLNASNLASTTDILPPFQCGQSTWIVVYNESGLPVQLNTAVPFTGICPSTSAGIPFQFTSYQTITQNFNIGGYWRSYNATAPWEGATFNQFSPGHYTLLAYDPWTQPITLNFTVA